MKLYKARDVRAAIESAAALATFTRADRLTVSRAADRVCGVPVLLTFIDLNRFAANQRKPVGERVAVLDHAQKLKRAAIGGLPHAVLSLPLSSFPGDRDKARKTRAALAARVRKLTDSDRAELLNLTHVCGDLR